MEAELPGYYSLFYLPFNYINPKIDKLINAKTNTNERTVN
jgi:hypothetical protein